METTYCFISCEFECLMSVEFMDVRRSLHERHICLLKSYVSFGTWQKLLLTDNSEDVRFWHESFKFEDAWLVAFGSNPLGRNSQWPHHVASAKGWSEPSPLGGRCSFAKGNSRSEIGDSQKGVETGSRRSHRSQKRTRTEHSGKEWWSESWGWISRRIPPAVQTSARRG